MFVGLRQAGPDRTRRKGRSAGSRGVAQRPGRNRSSVCYRKSGEARARRQRCGAQPDPRDAERRRTSGTSGRCPGRIDPASSEVKSALLATIRVLIKELAGEEPKTRIHAAIDLSTIRPAARVAVPALTRSLKDPEFSMHFQVATALGKIGPEARSAVPALVAAMQKDKDGHITWAAAGALGGIGPQAKSAVPALGWALTSPDPTLRGSAAKAWATSRTRRSRPFPPSSR